MKDIILVERNPDSQCAVPSVWRSAITAIVDAFAEGDYELSRAIPGVPVLDDGVATSIAENIQEYGAQLISLPDESWDTSVVQWMGDYWDVLVDLFTREEGASDMALSIRVYEVNDEYSFRVLSVHVP